MPLLPAAFTGLGWDKQCETIGNLLSAQPFCGLKLNYNYYSAVVGSIMFMTSLTEFAGKLPCFACSRTISSFGAM